MERAVEVGRVVKEEAAPILELNAAPVEALLRPTDLYWAVATRAPIWLARRKAFIFFAIL
jgi:hypothetical protein